MAWHWSCAWVPRRATNKTANWGNWSPSSVQCGNEVAYCEGISAGHEDRSAHVATVNDGENGDDTSDIDYEDVHEADIEDSNADDEETICYSKQAQELKETVRKKMLGEDHPAATIVPEEFIVPENIKEQVEDGSDCFDSEDELSYDDDSDGIPMLR